MSMEAIPSALGSDCANISSSARGPQAVRLGYDAGISCHGTRMLDFIQELDGVTAPICIIWGDQDHAAPAEVLAAYRTDAHAEY
jgi:dienelactone hydrolase